MAIESSRPYMRKSACYGIIGRLLGYFYNIEFGRLQICSNQTIRANRFASELTIKNLEARCLQGNPNYQI